MPFAGFFTTKTNSTDRNDIFLERFGIFHGELIANYSAINAHVIAVSDEYVIVGLNLTGIATETGKSWNSKTTITHHFVVTNDTQGIRTEVWTKDRKVLVDHLEIVSDSDPLINAFTPDPIATSSMPITSEIECLCNETDANQSSANIFKPTISLIKICIFIVFLFV